MKKTQKHSRSRIHTELDLSQVRGGDGIETSPAPLPPDSSSLPLQSGEEMRAQIIGMG